MSGAASWPSTMAGSPGSSAARSTPATACCPARRGEIALYVVPGARGQGLSRRLAEAAVAWLRERGAGWMVQMRVCSQDTEAIAFWSSLGFEPDMTVMSLYAG